MEGDLMIKDELISVIIPIYNSEKYLRMTLESLKQQTYTEFEAIMIDDGSTDSSGIIADKFAEQDRRFHVIHVKNGGVSKARNIGLDYAIGKWIYCLDSDDRMEPNMFEKMIDCSNNSQMVVASVQIEELQRNKIRKLVHKKNSFDNREKIANYLVMVDEQEKDLLLNYLWNRLMKREVIEAAHLRFDETITLGEDFLFICNFLEHCNNITLIDDILYHYYIRGSGSLVGKFDQLEYIRREKMRKTLQELMISFGAYERAHLTVSKNEGRYCIYGMEKINLKSCLLSGKEKRIFIRKFLTRDNIELMNLYLKDAPGKNNTIWKILIKIRSATLISVYLGIKKMFM